MATRPLKYLVHRFSAAIVAALLAVAGILPVLAQDVCVGDCDANGAVFVDELLVGVNIALGQVALAQCSAFDADDSSAVEVDELIQGVSNALNGCPAAPTPTPTPMRVDRVVIAAGEEWRVPAGTTIIADNGMEIAGDIIAEGRGGDLELRAEQGDIVLLGGTVGFADSEEENEEPVLRASRATSGARSAGHASGLTVIKDGGDLLISSMNGIVSLRRHPTSGILPRISAQDGESAIDRSVVNWSPGLRESTIKADDGGEGGDIVIIGGANGRLFLPPTVAANEGPILRVGRGGTGGSVAIEPGFETDTEILTIIGGRGGRSGRLRLQSIVSVEVPPRLPGALIVTGRGGGGGGVAWAVGGSNGADAPMLPLVVLTMIGGSGGDGLSQGGFGFAAYYNSGVVINKRGTLVTSVLLHGGRGGDVFGAPSPIALIEALGGHGGIASGVGNRGWDGGLTDDGNLLTKGAKGGSLSAVGGNGGDVLGTVITDFARGGPGAACPARLSDGTPDFVAAGPGGNGYDACDGCAGGDGGDSGDLSCSGGTGGNISQFGDLAALQPGDGGGVLGTYGTLRAGNGGDGNPPGMSGARGLVSASVGRGGVRGQLKGDDGTVTGEQRFAPDAEAGTTCGQGLQCGCPNGTCNCCPPRCYQQPPTNTGIRILRFTNFLAGDGFSRTIDVTGAYNPCGQRDQLGNCQGKYTFTCALDGAGHDCIAAEVAILDLTGRTGGFLIQGGAFCLGMGNLCIGDGRPCSLTVSGNGQTSTTTWRCTNCGDFGASCVSETYSGCRCLNFDRTGPGLSVVCPPPCSGRPCAQ